MAQSAAATTTWNAEHTDSKGYWVATPDQAIERIDVEWPLETSEETTFSAATTEQAAAPAPPVAHQRAPRQEARNQQAATPIPPAARRALRAGDQRTGSQDRLRVDNRLPVAPIAAAALPAAFSDGFEVPEFTLSEKRSNSEKRSSSQDKKLNRLQARADEALARWEVLETLIPSDAFEEVPTEEVARPPACNVKVFARSSAFTEAITQDIPPFAAATPTPAKLLPAAPVAQPAAPAAIEAQVEHAVASTRPLQAEAPAAPSLEEKRELAKQMAADAITAATAQGSRNRSPGSLPPVQSLMSAPPAPVHLSARSRESWSWDEADPLAVAQPARPSLSLVQSAPPAHDDYEHFLATPMPSPPRPNCNVPWPLPQKRAAVGEPGQVAHPEELVVIDGLDSISLNEPLAQPLTDDASTNGSMGTWLAVAGLAGLCACAAVLSLALCTAAALAVVLA